MKKLRDHLEEETRQKASLQPHSYETVQSQEHYAMTKEILASKANEYTFLDRALKDHEKQKHHEHLNGDQKYYSLPLFHEVEHSRELQRTLSKEKREFQQIQQTPQNVKNKHHPVEHIISILNQGDSKVTGWIGDMSRQQAEELLKSCPLKTFVLRWSSHTDSLVLSYTFSKAEVKHRVGIQLDCGRGKTLQAVPVIVETSEGQNQIHKNLFEYLTSLQKEGTIGKSADSLFGN